MKSLWYAGQSACKDAQGCLMSTMPAEVMAYKGEDCLSDVLQHQLRAEP